MDAVFGVKQRATVTKAVDTGIFIVDPPHPENFDGSISKDGFYYSPLGKYSEINRDQNAHIYRSKLAISRRFLDKNVGRFLCTSAFGIEAVTELDPSPIISAVSTQLHADLLNDKFNNIISNLDNKDNQKININAGFAVNLSWKQPSIFSKTFNDNDETVFLFIL